MKRMDNKPTEIQLHNSEQ